MFKLTLRTHSLFPHFQGGQEWGVDEDGGAKGRRGEIDEGEEFLNVFLGELGWNSGDSIVEQSY